MRKRVIKHEGMCIYSDLNMGAYSSGKNNLVTMYVVAMYVHANV